MPLICSCPDFDPDDTWWYYGYSEYIELKTQRGRRCCSCKNIIKPGSICTEHNRCRQPITWVEEIIYDDQVPMAFHYMCERCSDLFFSLVELGYCVSPGENMSELVKEYSIIHRSNNHV